jgi:Spy/CpxP family protein refolding chaperone
MRTHSIVSGIALALAQSVAGGQASAPKDSLVAPTRVPAQSLLDVAEVLQLSEPQLARLRALARTQTATLSRMTASYLRAEADVLDASRKDDLVLRRLALEKRAKAAIDGEMSRLQEEKDSRAVLTADQREKLQGILDRIDTEPKVSQAALWSALVSPSPLTRRIDLDSVVRDSGQVRLKVIPSYAEIYIDGAIIGTNFKQVSLPIGLHTATFKAPGCGSPVEQQITVIKGQLLIVAPVAIVGC